MESIDDDWLGASEAINVLLKSYGGAFQAAQALINRAGGGLVMTRARLYQRIQERHYDGKPSKVGIDETVLPKEFWQFELKAHLSQNWVSGDFANRSNHAFRGKAFGVEFSKSDVQNMLPKWRLTEPFHDDESEQTEKPRPIRNSITPSDEEIQEKMLELIAMGMTRDVAAKVIRQVAGFEAVGNEHARRVVSGVLARGRPKKNA